MRSNTLRPTLNTQGNATKYVKRTFNTVRPASDGSTSTPSTANALSAKVSLAPVRAAAGHLRHRAQVLDQAALLVERRARDVPAVVEDLRVDLLRAAEVLAHAPDRRRSDLLHLSTHGERDCEKTT